MSRSDVNRSTLTLRGVLLLFLLVMLATFVLRISITNIELPLIRVVTAIFIVGGFSAVTIMLLQLPLANIVGERPRIFQLILGLVAGAALWLPGWWLIIVLNAAFNTFIGFLPLASENTAADRIAIVIQFGVVVPLLHAFLFFGLLQRGSTLRMKLTGVVVAAALYGAYSLLSTQYASSGVLSYFLLGFVAAAAVYFSNSIFPGAAVLIGFSIVRPLIDQSRMGVNLQNFLFPADMPADAALFGGRFILLVLVGGFVSFLCLQVLRVSAEPRLPTSIQKSEPKSEPKEVPSAPITMGRGWWMPLVALLLLIGVIAYSEIQLRLLNPAPSSDSTFTLTQ